MLSSLQERNSGAEEWAPEQCQVLGQGSAPWRSPGFHGAAEVTSRAHGDWAEPLSASAHGLSITQIALGRKASPSSEHSKQGSVKWLWPLRNHNKFQEGFGKHNAVSTKTREHFREVPKADLSQLFHTAQAGIPQHHITALCTPCMAHLSTTSVLLGRTQAHPHQVLWRHEIRFAEMFERFRPQIPS